MGETAEPTTVRPFAWEEPLRGITKVIARLGLAYLFFSNLFWKLPPRFGCGSEFTFTSAGPGGELVRTSGLCDWVGLESVFAARERSFFAIYGPDGNSLFSTGLGPLVKLNGFFVDRVVQPAFGFFGWAVFVAELFVAVTLFLGFLSRAGALVSLFLSLQLMLGLAGAWDPATNLNEWEWSYHLMVLLSLLVLGIAPGRFFGFDGLLRPRLAAASERGNWLAKLYLAFS
jgi:uncharacterized membrane protein YphA (DoxX/SURF4 family)